MVSKSTSAGVSVSLPRLLEGGANCLPVAHVGLVPMQFVPPGAAVAMLAIGALSAVAAIGIFRRRDPLGA